MKNCIIQHLRSNLSYSEQFKTEVINAPVKIKQKYLKYPFFFYLQNITGQSTRYFLFEDIYIHIIFPVKTYPKSPSITQYFFFVSELPT